ncbi:29562_t:CDS:2, partial [Gigaspora margarita]
MSGPYNTLCKKAKVKAEEENSSETDISSDNDSDQNEDETDVNNANNMLWTDEIVTIDTHQVSRSYYTSFQKWGWLKPITPTAPPKII